MANNQVIGESPLAQLVKSKDWSITSLDSTASWPDTLLVAVNMILSAPIPMQLFWEPDFICIYNDAMAPALSDKHPLSLGEPARSVWQEAWDLIGPQMEQVLSSGQSLSFTNALVPLLMNGRIEDRYWTYSYSPVFGSNGVIAGVLGDVQDTTEAVLNRRERDRVQQALHLSEERFRLLVDRASVGINIGNASGSLTYINQALLRLLDYTAEDVAEGRVRWDQLTPPQYAEADKEALAQLKAYGVAAPYEKLYKSRSGQLIPVQVGAVLIPALSGDTLTEDIAVFFTDLTTQKKAEAALLQSEKVTAVGKLASAISHEINNPLEAITNILFIVRRLPELSQEACDYLDVAERELARVSQVAAQTLSYHRLSNSAMTVTPDHLLDEVLSLYTGRLTNYAITVVRKYEAGLSLTCFEGDIRRVLNNIVTNAIGYMLSGGTLTLRTRKCTRGSSGQKGVLFTIADTGPGFAPGVRNRIFDAFFTTRDIHGTGLGLWIACRVVHKHRGYVRAYSASFCKGAVFQLWLPLELAPSAHEPWHVLASGPGLI